MKSLLRQNLRLTLLLAAAFTAVGYTAGWAASFYTDAYATKFELYSFAGQISNLVRGKSGTEQLKELNSGELELWLKNASSIETARLDDIRKLQVAIALSGTATGILVAQTTFVAYALNKSRDQR
ncbi:MAG: hypothetical protein WA949_20285 [Phormidesmis sp.]